MLRQEQQLKPYKKVQKFEDMKLYQKEEELIPFEQAVAWAVIAHVLLLVTSFTLPLILQLAGLDLSFFKKPKLKPRDIEFVLVTQPEKEPINKNTPLRSDRNTQAGGIHDPNKKIAPPQPALPQSAPSQQGQKSKPKAVQQSAPTKAVKQPQQQPAPKPKEQPKQVAKAPTPPKPIAKPSMPMAKAPSAMKLPVPSSKGTRISTATTQPVTTRPSGTYGGHSSSSPRPITASGGYGSTSRMYPNGTGRGSAYSPGGGSAGNPGPGNPKGAPGVDAIAEPNFGPYMSELQRRIKANWDPPRGDESKRVVLLFRIAKDGRLLSVKVVKSSGSVAADKAALHAVELTAPFRSLPANFRESSVDIQFTFDYNVFGVNRY